MRKLLAVILGISLLATAFKLGTLYANKDKSDIAQADEQLNVTEQQPDLTSSATTQSTDTGSTGSNTSSQKGTSASNNSGAATPQFTLVTLAKYNGKNGAKAYIAYSGKVYDVSNSKYFKNGVHIYDSNVKSGTDITSQMDQAPSSHTSKNYIGTLPVVGVLVAKITNSSSTSISLASSSVSSSIISIGGDDGD